MVRVGLTRFKRPPPTYHGIAQGPAITVSSAMHAWGQAHLFTEDQYWQVVIYKCWDPLDLSALRYPLITTLCPPPSSLPTSPSCNSSPRARYISTLQSAGLGYKLRS